MNEEYAFHSMFSLAVWQEGNETAESFSVFSGKLSI